MIRRPALLGPTLAEVARLDPVDMSVTLKLTGANEATMTIDENAPAVKIRDWIAVYTRRGFNGYYRVTNIAHTLKKQAALTLLHGRDILNDSVWAAQTDFEGTRTQYLTALLNQQTQLINGVKPWTLGTCADTSTVKRSINYDNLATLLEEMEEEGSDYYFTYDQSVFPWVINYVAKNQTVTSEFRLTRNIRSATVTYNDADLCTRLILSDNVKSVDSDTDIESTDTLILTYNNTAAQTGDNGFGVVVKTADIDTSDDITATTPVTTEADAWAADFLAARAAPSVQIQIDGDELQQLTGEDWDEPDLGRLCRVALPAYGHTFEERVVSIVYPDIKDTSHITVSLSNTLPKFSDTISMIRKTADKAARATRRLGRTSANAKDEVVWSKHVKYYGDALDGTGILTLYESGIDMDASGGVKIFSLTEGVQALYADFTVNSNAITSVVQKTGVNSLGQGETLYSKINQEAGRIDLVVSGSGQQASIRIDSIVDGINNSGSSVTIDAGKIYLNGQVIANSISAVNTEISNLKTGVTKATLINADSVVADNLSGGTVYGTSVSVGSGTSGGSGTLYYRGNQYYRQGVTLGSSGSYIAEGHFLGDSSTTLNLNHYHTITAAEGTGADAGKIILTLGGPSASEGSTNFNIADTAFYRNHVGIDNSGSWLWDSSDEVYYRTITAKDGTDTTINLPTITATAGNWSNNISTVDVTGPGGHSITSVNVNASSLVTAATYAGKASVTLVDPTWNALSGPVSDTRTLTVTTSGRTNSAGTTDNLSKSAALYLTGSGLTVSLRHGSSSGTEVATKTLTDANLAAGNIKNGVSIFGVTGTYSGSSANEGLASDGAAISSGHSSYDMDDTGISPLLDKTGTRLELNKYYRVLVTAKNGDRGGVKFRTPSATASFSRVNSLPSGKTATTFTPGTLWRFVFTVNNSNINDVYYAVPV